MKTRERFEISFNSDLPYYNLINSPEIKELIFLEFKNQDLIPSLKLYRLNFYNDKEWSDFVLNDLIQEKGSQLQQDFYKLISEEKLPTKFYINDINNCFTIVKLNNIKNNYLTFMTSFKNEKFQKAKKIVKNIKFDLENINTVIQYEILEYLISCDENIILKVNDFQFIGKKISNYQQKTQNWKEQKIEFNNHLNEYKKTLTFDSIEINKTEEQEIKEELNGIEYFDFFLNHDLRKKGVIMSDEEYLRFKEYLTYYFINDMKIPNKIIPIKANTTKGVLIYSMKEFYKNKNSSAILQDSYFQLMKEIFINLNSDNISNMRKQSKPQYFNDYL